MITLRHAIGRSTLAEGIAIPKNLEDWIGAPPPGQKKTITLIFGDQRTAATLRRLANERGHVQVKYENKDALPFRSWLSSVFAATRRGAKGEYLELVRADCDTFCVKPFPLDQQPRESLVVADWMFHRTSDKALQDYGAIQEIPAIVRGIEFRVSEGQSFYNRQLAQGFVAWHWEAEKRVIPQLPLKSDFVKGMVQVEVEFGNARTYYQDYVKFLLAFNRQVAEVGVLLVPTEQFARMLCDVGRKKALAKGRHSYSGMIHIAKVRRELSHLSFMLNMPLAIAGIGANVENQ